MSITPKTIYEVASLENFTHPVVQFIDALSRINQLKKLGVPRPINDKLDKKYTKTRAKMIKRLSQGRRATRLVKKFENLKAQMIIREKASASQYQSHKR